jgi:glycerol-3-phosphate cytidylyltransferase
MESRDVKERDSILKFKMKNILTYGTFDLFHIGHLNMLRRLKSMGTHLIVGVSTDTFNLQKGKKSIYSYQERSEIVGALDCVDQIIPEDNWEQKGEDIQKYNIDVFGIGEDWQGEFDHLKGQCEVVYLPRTPSISTTEVKQALSHLNSEKIKEIKDGLDGVLDIVKALG